MINCTRERAGESFTISTILEDMFDWIDGDHELQRSKYKVLGRDLRLAIAMSLFAHAGLAELDRQQKPMPMLVPSEELKEELATSFFTTSVKPLVIGPSVLSGSKNGSKRVVKYAQAVERVLPSLPAYFDVARSALTSLEVGWAQHFRRDDGTLGWSLTAAGVKAIEGGTLANLTSRDTHGGLH
jgi:hypothetical protein